MSFLNWQTLDRLEKIEADLKEVVAADEYKVSTRAAVDAVGKSLLDLIEALRKEPGPHINYDI